MKIPERIEQVLKTNDRHCGAILQTLADFEIWLKDNKVPFFPEYTDHGPDHVESVMRGAEGLIRDDAWQVLTAADAAVLLLAILLHDCAMHLSEDGFLALVGPAARRSPRSAYFYDLAEHSWADAWVSFLQEASRFDQQKLIALFGEPESARKPPERPIDWTRRDHLLIGEFLRRHHARLAHEIALAGVPGPTEKRLTFARMDDWMRDLAGFVGRSHNLDIRACVDRLPRNGKRVWRDVHAPFLMALLRVADYLEIRAPRAPAEVLQVRRLESPISRQEWRKHSAVMDIRYHEDDREALWVDAEPKDLKTFLGLKRLFEGIQQELDASWAVLGEVYGADPNLRELGLTIRRVRSTLDNFAEFGKTVGFLPAHARFQAAGGDLLKVLVRPLYGNDPGFGVRELMQNAVDAVRELRDCLRQRPRLVPDVAELHPRADVVISLEELEDGTGTLTVEDRGIGMTPEIIMGYFLTAGASFRSSDAWRRLHEDQAGHSRVLRSGRFGVGVLAAFLLGEEIEVTTRHVDASADRGVRFKAHLSDPEIELQWCERKVGTTIRVTISNREIVERLVLERGRLWEWYCLEDPRVARRVRVRQHRKVSREEYELPTDQDVWLRQRFVVPPPNEALSARWVRLAHPDYDDVHWGWCGPGKITHNGIIVDDNAVRSYVFRGEHAKYIWAPEEQFKAYARPLKRPDISVFDSKGAFPLNLHRTGCSTTSTPLDAALVHPVWRDILAFLLVRLLERQPDVATQLRAASDSALMQLRGPLNLSHPALRTAAGEVGFHYHWLLRSREGILLNEHKVLSAYAPKTIYMCPPGTEVRAPWISRLLKSRAESRYVEMLHDGVSQRASWGSLATALEVWNHGVLLDTVMPSFGQDEGFYRYAIGATFGAARRFSARCRLLVMTRQFAQVSKIFQGASEGCSVQVGNWIVCWSGGDPREEIDIDGLARIVPSSPLTFFGCWLLDGAIPPDLPSSPLADAWMQYFRQPVLPVDLAERREQLACAYEELAPEIERWEELTAAGWPFDHPF